MMCGQWSGRIVAALVLGVLRLVSVRAQDQGLEGTLLSETRGYFKRQHSLVRPYQSAGMEVPFWDIVGSTMVSNAFVRLTPDQQSKQGAIWNRIVAPPPVARLSVSGWFEPVASRDWELQVSLRVHGSKGEMFGDGLAIWYTAERNQLGPVFGNKDYFRGLGIFLDTYSNHNGPHQHGHPYVSAMVANGDLHYDHDRDGTHTQLGGEAVGCESKLRNKDYDAHILVRYVGDTLSVYTDTLNRGSWTKCMTVSGVRLPTGYFFGVTAATGELSDNHDVTGVRVWELEWARAEREADVHRVVPEAEVVAAPRDHVEQPRPSKLGAFGTFVLVVFALIAVVLFVGFGYVFVQNRQERSRKRFY